MSVGIHYAPVCLCFNDSGLLIIDCKNAVQNISQQAVA